MWSFINTNFNNCIVTVFLRTPPPIRRTGEGRVLRNSPGKKKKKRTTTEAVRRRHPSMDGHGPGESSPVHSGSERLARNRGRCCRSRERPTFVIKDSEIGLEP